MVDEEMGVLVGVLVREERGKGWGGVEGGEGDGGWVCRGRYSILEMRNIF